MFSFTIDAEDYIFPVPDGYKRGPLVDLIYSKFLALADAGFGMPTTAWIAGYLSEDGTTYTCYACTDLDLLGNLIQNEDLMNLFAAKVGRLPDAPRVVEVVRVVATVGEYGGY